MVEDTVIPPNIQIGKPLLKPSVSPRICSGKPLNSKKGDWLLASYDAAGLEAIPIPIHAANADDSILAFVEAQRNEQQHRGS